MPLKILIFIFIMATVLGSQSQAASYRRLVNFEWDPIEGATSYDVELAPFKEAPAATDEGPAQPKPELKKFAFKSDKPSWNGKITPGKYMMRLRSRDYRGVPGDWSPQSEFDVGLDIVAAKSPLQDTKISAPGDLEHEVNFSWQPVGDAKTYNFELASEDGSFTKTESVTGTSLDLKIPVAANYTWKISATSKDNIRSESITENQFSVLGPIVGDPQITKPESQFVREIFWSKPEHVSTYDVYLLKLNTKNRKWEKFQTYEKITNESLPFEATWPGGKYQMALRAKGKLRGNSKLVKQSFDVADGDRSPASEYTALVRASIDRVSGWFGIASYLVTQAKFEGTDPSTGGSVTYQAIGGTGRFGAGWISSKSFWGFLSIVDLSGFIINGKNQTFASLELNSVYRNYIGNRSELRLQAGLVYKEIPQSIADDLLSSTRETKISTLGPHLGAEYWYSLTPKLGIQFNTHLYFSSLKVNTPNGQSINPTQSNQIGFLGSYRFNQKFTGLVGYARREDKASYKGDVTAFSAQGGEPISTVIVGHYLNFFAEWSF